MTRFAVAVLALLASCVAGVQSRFPTDVQTALARDDMRRLETERFIIYYPSSRRALVDRFLVRADRCARTLREHAILRDSPKIVIVMPDAAFNNAFVAPDALGYEQVSVVPTYSTLDFTTSFGLPPDPAAIACHELVHYVQFQQTAGFWGMFNKVFGAAYTPQLGFDPWFVEGLATHYEARLSPGLGRPAWPIFTGMFAAAYAGGDISTGELSSYARNAPVGHHYLVGSMFVRFLVERYGERPLWVAVDHQARSYTGWFFGGAFKEGFARSFDALFDEFRDWVAQNFMRRARPPQQRVLQAIGNDARYARGRDGTEAWVAEDVDVPARLTVRDPRGNQLLHIPMVGVVPPRKLVLGAPLLTSGLSITADGSEVWLTAIDLGGTYQVTRLLRWRRGARGLEEVARDLGPGATIDPTGRTYYYCEVDGDRWSLAAYDVRSGSRRVLVDMKPGTYVLGAQISADGKLLAANVWDGTAFVVWVVDAATGAVVRTIGGTGTPVYDASFASDGRLVWLGVVDGRFQVLVEGVQATDAPYAVLAAREANGTLRFLDRQGWSWQLAEVPMVATPVPPPAPPAADDAPTPAPATDDPVPSAADDPAPPSTDAPPTGTDDPLPTTIADEAPTTEDARPPAPGDTPPPPTTTMDTPPPAATGAPAMTPPTVALYPAIARGFGPGDAVAVQSDEPYSALDRVFYPQIRSPTILVQSPRPHIGLLLGGADRLELQRWSLAGYYQPGGDTPHYGASAAYLNNMLAPVYVVAAATFLDWETPVADAFDPRTTYDEEHRTRDASLLVGATYRGALSGAIGGVYTDDFEQLEDEMGLHRRVGGPAISVQWYSAETTRYTGPRRALLLEGEAAFYPEQWSTFSSDIVDVSGTFGFTLPLPLGRRHTITAFARARNLIADGETNLLQVGGDSALAILWNRSNRMEPPPFDDTRFPPNLRFIEPLRGFEDLAIPADRVKLGELSWKYPLVIDRGTATTLFMPASYLRQLDLELFGTIAVVEANDRHHAVGAAITLRMQLLRVPLAVMYQVARRTSDDQAIAQFVGLGPDL